MRLNPDTPRASVELQLSKLKKAIKEMTDAPAFDGRETVLEALRGSQRLLEGMLSSR